MRMQVLHYSRNDYKYFLKIKYWVFLYGECKIDLYFFNMYVSDEIILNANLMQQGDFINVFLARHVLGTYAHHQEH